MSDQDKPVLFAGKPSPGETPATEGADQSRPVTLMEAQQLIQAAVNQTLSKNQSQVDRSEARIKKEIQDRLAQIEQAQKTLRAAGVEITPEVQERVRRQVIDDSLLGAPSAPARPDEAAPGGGGGDSSDDPVNKTALAMMNEAGVMILDSDPESTALDYTSQRAFLRSLDQAIEAKRARMNQPGTPQQPARAPTNLAGQGTRTGLMEQYQAEMTKSASLPQHVRLEIRRKYRRLGLNV